MPLTEKSRVLDRRRLYNHRAYTSNVGEVLSDTVWDTTLYSREVTRSEGHRWPKDRGVRDAGGPFIHYVQRYNNADRGYYTSYNSYSLGFHCLVEGNAIPYGSFPNCFTSETMTIEQGLLDWTYAVVPQDLVQEGTRMIARTIPTNPVVDGSVSLAELFREGIPSMIGSILLKEKANFFRSLGSEYLNVELGWKPLIADLRNAAKAVFESHEILQSLAANSGKDLHRHYFIPESTIQTQMFASDHGEFPPGLIDGNYYSPASRLTYTDIARRKTWFSGCYTYYFDPATLSAASRIATEARLLYGLQLTPEVLWNLAPWSWLVDWFANVGPLLHNVSAFQSDGLVLKYGYVMERSRRTYKRWNTLGSLINPGSSDWPHLYADRFTGEVKRREKATPFGFGLNSVDFTTRQWAILGALGLTRAPKAL